MKKINLEIDEDLFAQSIGILEDVGMDIQTIFKVLLKRVVKEKNITFLFQKNDAVLAAPTFKQETGNDVCDAGSIKMTKTKAKYLLKNAGFEVTNRIAFASKNRTVANYWSNPSVDVLNEDFTLILNDVVSKKLFLFIIPAHSISPDELIKRADQPYLIDLQIAYNDSTFTDNRSGYRFSKFLITELNY